MKLLLIFIAMIVTFNGAWARRENIFFMGRSFILTGPDKSSVSARPLIVLLHGCKQNADLILTGTNMDEEAKKNDFFVLAPEQPDYYNMDHCWNWFLDFQQQRNMANEMAQIIGGIEYVKTSKKIDVEKIFVAGISAGGAMTHNLAVCYPDVFSGAAVHSGLNYKAAETISEAQTVLTSYRQKAPEYLAQKMLACPPRGYKQRLKGILILHGLADSRVPPLHPELISRSQAVWRDLLDDETSNGSVKGNLSVQVLHPRSGFKVHQFDTKYPGFLERRIMVEKLGHAWGGGKPLTVNFDPAAPSSNEFIFNFFGLTK